MTVANNRRQTFALNCGFIMVLSLSALPAKADDTVPSLAPLAVTDSQPAPTVKNSNVETWNDTKNTAYNPSKISAYILGKMKETVRTGKLEEATQNTVTTADLSLGASSPTIQPSTAAIAGIIAPSVPPSPASAPPNTLELKAVTPSLAATEKLDLPMIADTSGKDTHPLPMAPADGGAIQPEMAKAGAEDLQMLEQENQVLREKLHIGETDKLNDIRVDFGSTNSRRCSPTTAWSSWKKS